MACATAARVAFVSLSGLSIMKSWIAAVVADGGHVDPIRPQAPGVRLALVAQDVALVHDHERRRG